MMTEDCSIATFKERMKSINDTVKKMDRDTIKEMEDRYEQYRINMRAIKNNLQQSSSRSLLPRTPNARRNWTGKISTIPEDDVGNLSVDEQIEIKKNDKKSVRNTRLFERKQNIEETKVSLQPRPTRVTRASTRASTRHLQNHTNDFQDFIEPAPIKIKTEKLSTESRSSVRNIYHELEAAWSEDNKTPQNIVNQEVKTKSKRKRTVKINSSIEENNEMVQSDEPPVKRSHVVNETDANEGNEETLYEDAIEKPSNMNSMMNSGAHSLNKMNPQIILKKVETNNVFNANETYVLKIEENQRQTRSKNKSLETKSSKTKPSDFVDSGPSCESNSLITDDESPTEIKKTKSKRILRSSLMSDDDIVIATPPKAIKKPFLLQKSIMKEKDNEDQFSAFTSKSRAAKTIARKRAKEAQDEEDEEFTKENENRKRKKEKKFQDKFTPTKQNRILVPSSSSRYKTPTRENNIPRPLTSSKYNNLVTNVESFLTRSVSKANSAEKSRDKIKKVDIEDPVAKRAAVLRALSEQKKQTREMKEQRNKKARLDKEKRDQEKRLQAEKEKEEKARTAYLLQERIREEAEKKRALQLQRNMEIEERRKKEEILRQQRLLEQEEAERKLAEQKKLEVEAEKRKQAEAKARQEAMKKAKQWAKQKQAQLQKQNLPESYKLDSEPDDNTDDELQPKHTVPAWATSSARKKPLCLQSFIPKKTVMKFFNTKRCTPDLTELFKDISKHRLQRTSSANWKTPPRYSEMLK